MKANDASGLYFLSHKPMFAIHSTKIIILIIFVKINFGNIIKKRASKQRLTGQN
jgi:hypothetical protein